jgi:dienelactone hydrolase
MRNRLVGFTCALLCASVATLGAAAPPGASAAPPPSGSDLLDYGPHAVGFRIIPKRDASREYFLPGSTDDLHGSYGPRSVQVVVWYPVSRAAAKGSMTFRDYVLAGAEEEVFGPPSQARRDRALEDFRRDTLAQGADPRDLDRLLDSKVRASRDAPPEPGTFPLVLYAHNFTYEKSVLCEYLASHGFVVASVPFLGTYERDPDVGVTLVETEIRDLEVALDVLSGDSGSGNRRVGIVGMSFGALSALGLEMRHPRVAAVVSLDGGIGSATDPYMLKQSPFYSLERARAPLLHLYGTDVAGTDVTFVRGLKYSERWLVGFPGLRHGDFAGYGILTAAVPRIRGEAPANVPAATSRAFRYVSEFLRQYLVPEAAGRGFLEGNQEKGPADNPKIERLRALTAPPRLEELKVKLRKEGMASLVDLHDALRRDDPQPFGQETFRLIGSWLLEQGRAPDARRWFQLQIADYPASAQAHYSYALSSQRADDPKAAREHFEKALVLLESDADLDAPSRERLAKRATTALNNLPR